MKIRHILVTALIILGASGCGTSKHLDRDRVLFESANSPIKTGLRSFRTSSNTFNGSLNILYEKKIKGVADSPFLTFDGHLAFYTTRHRFLVYDQMSGDKVCRIKKRRGLVLNAVVQDSLLVLVKRSKYGHIQVINLFTGKVIGERTLIELRSGPIIVSDNLIYGTSKGLLALSLPDLQTVWRSDSQAMVDIEAVSDSDIIYFAANGTLMALQSTDGSKIWQTDCGSAVVSELSIGERIYLGVADGRMMAIDKEDGQVAWDQQLGIQAHGGAAESDGRIFFGGTDRNVYCLSSISGEEIWKYKTDGIVTASPLIYGRAVLVGSHDRHFYSIDKTDGKLIDRRRLEGPITLAAAIDNDRIFVTCRKKRLYCFEGN